VVRQRQQGRSLQLPSQALDADRPDLVVVGFDTATSDTVACAWRDGEVLNESRVGPGPDGRPLHAVRLLPAIEAAATAAGGWERVDLLAAGLGPGSFTGLRIGIATARGLRASLGLRATGVSTLDALARGIGERAGEGRQTMAILDARRGEVYAALYGGGGERLSGPAAVEPSAIGSLLAGAAGTPLAAGSGAVRFRQELVPSGIEIPEDPDPVHRVSARQICELAAAGGGESPDDGLDPNYLRPPDAERWRERDT